MSAATTGLWPWARWSWVIRRPRWTPGPLPSRRIRVFRPCPPATSGGLIECGRRAGSVASPA